MSELVVTKDQPKMIHPTIAAELPGIKLESDQAAPSRVQVLTVQTSPIVRQLLELLLVLM